jgi:hypothetical protein
MPFPTPEPGLVVSYAYVWDHEAQSGRDEGRKDRPCVIVLAVERQQDGETLATLLPVTHRAPQDVAAAVEIPSAVKQLLGLDHERSWIVVSEGDQFIWPGYDLRKVRNYDYGYLPPRFFEDILASLLAWHRTNRVTLTAR